MLTWAGVPPLAVTLSASPVAVTLNAAADASGAPTIGTTEVDYYAFTAPRAGNYTISATTPASSLNTVLAVFSSAGQRLAYNNDITNATNTDSRLTIALTAGVKYYVGITNASTASRGSYTWTIDGPAATSTPPTTPATPTSNSGFQITLSMSGLTASQQAVFQQAAKRWQEIIVGDLPNATYRGLAVDDILINASSASIDGVNGVLGQAWSDAFRSGSVLPYHGVMQFDSADVASMERSGLLQSVVLHEMGHVLGIGTIWGYRGLISGARTSNPIFVGAHATAAYNQMFGTSARGVPVESTGGAGTADCALAGVDLCQRADDGLGRSGDESARIFGHGGVVVGPWLHGEHGRGQCVHAFVVGAGDGAVGVGREVVDSGIRRFGNRDVRI